MLHRTTLLLIDQIEQSAAEHRAHVARIRQAGRDAADRADIEVAKANHPAGKRLEQSVQDYADQVAATRAEIVRLRAESDLAPVIELFGGVRR